MKIIILASLLVSLFLGFQNCAGEFSTSAEWSSSKALEEEMRATDERLLPKLLESPSLVYWIDQKGMTKKNQYPFFLEAFTVVGVFKIQGREPGPLFTLSAGDSQFASLKMTESGIQMIHGSADGAYSFLTSDFRLNSTSEALVIGARFGKQANDLTLMINGQVVASSAEVQTQGSVGPYLYLHMKIQEQIQQEELMIYSGTLQPQEINSLSRFVATSNNLQAIPYLPIPDILEPTIENLKFTAAQNIIKLKCATCHSSWASYSEESYLTAKASNGLPLLVKADLRTSQLWARMIGTTEGNPDLKDMPRTNNAPPGADTTPLNEAQLTILKAWILDN